VIVEMMRDTWIPYERGLRFFGLFEDIGFLFSPDGSLLTPNRGNVNAVNGVGEHSGKRLAAMSDRVGIEITGVRFVSLVGFDGNRFSHKGSRFGSCLASFFALDSDGMKEKINGAGRDIREGLRDFW
jgi:hypothetical protein